MELGGIKKRKTFSVPVEGSEYILDCDFVISAIGQAVDPEGLKNDTRLKITKWNTIDANKDTFETSIPGF